MASPTQHRSARPANGRGVHRDLGITIVADRSDSLVLPLLMGPPTAARGAALGLSPVPFPVREGTPTTAERTAGECSLPPREAIDGVTAAGRPDMDQIVAELTQRLNDAIADLGLDPES
jgi:hypothetical protein